MDIKDNRFDKLPEAGKLRFINEDGICRLLDSNGKVYRMRPEAGTPVHATAATQTLTFTGRAVADEQITIGGVIYTWKETVDGENQIKIGASTAAHDILALVAAVNASTAGSDEDLYGTDTVANPVWSAADGAGDTVVFTARYVGPFSDVASSSSMTNTSLGSMTNGAYATEARAGDEMFDADYRYLAVSDVSKTSTSGWTKTAHAAL